MTIGLLYAKAALLLPSLLALPIAAVGIFNAVQAQAPSPMQPTPGPTVQPRSVQLLPDATAQPSAPVQVEIPRPRIPIGDDALEQIKRAPSGPRSARPVPPAAAAEPQREAPSTNCTTNSATGFTPSDIHGAVGPTTLIEVTNVTVAAYDKTTCAFIAGNTLNNFFVAGVNEHFFSTPKCSTIPRWDVSSSRQNHALAAAAPSAFTSARGSLFPRTTPA